MLTSADIKNLIEAQKEAFYSKEELDIKFEDLRTDYSKLQSSVDGIAGSYKKTGEEFLAQTHRIDKLEEWANPVGKKVNIPLAL